MALATVRPLDVQRASVIPERRQRHFSGRWLRAECLDFGELQLRHSLLVLFVSGS
jgi:hypothetical protein